LASTNTRLLSRRGLVTGTLGVTASAAALALPARCRGRVYPGSSVLGTDLSGTTRSESRQRLEHAFAPFAMQAVTFTFEDRVWTASLSDLGYAIDFESMLDDAMTRGRGERITSRYASILGFGDDHEIPLVISSRAEKLRSYLAVIDDEIRIEPANARLAMSPEDEIEILPDRPGRKLDLATAESAVASTIAQGRHRTIRLESSEIPPAVTARMLAGAEASAIQLISAPVYFTHEGETYPVDTDHLANALIIDGDASSRLDAGLIADRVDAIVAAVRQSPRNVMLGWDAGLHVVENDAPGLELDREAFADALGTVAKSTTRTAPLPVRAVPAAARVDNMHDLGIEQHLAYGSSAFSGSSVTRETNVVVSANNISYKLVAPGEVFSFNQLLGPITPEMGYVAGTIIQGDWAATDIGGGVCQVSTTVFRAAAKAGFRFDEWPPHSWRLAFYEIDGSPPGFDAAIYQPNNDTEWEKDLTFVNPLDSWLLLMMVVDGDVVRAHFYGRDPGWTVEFGEAQVSEPKPIPEPVERYNPDLAQGERRLVQQARAGSLVRIRRTITDRDGAILADGDFVSDYRSQPEAWEIG
jgi:vancomycin resistance protein YoaR